jgi:hypothetical protein
VTRPDTETSSERHEQLRAYQLGDGVVDSVDLKTLLVSRGLRVPAEVYRRLSGSARLSPDPLACNCLILPDGTIVQLTDLALHMGYVRSAISWDLLRQLRYLRQLSTPFSLSVTPAGRAWLLHTDRPVTEVTFPSPSAFYDQHTSSGLPCRGNAVLQGREWLSFQCLWPCAYACASKPCQYCYSGGVFASLAKRGKPLPPFPTPQDAAEIAAWAFAHEESLSSIQITGGSTYDSDAECELITKYLQAIDHRVGCENIGGEIVVYATPPKRPQSLDRVFAAGADRVSMSFEIWDEKIAAAVMPGKAEAIDRARHLECLEYIVATHGPSSACSNFIIGLESAESCLEGAEQLAARGVVPIASVWIPFGRPVLGSMRAPGLSYFRRIKAGLARIYETCGLEPPGGSGLNVCMCKDVHRHRRGILVA